MATHSSGDRKVAPPFGVRSAMPMARAVKLAPHAIVKDEPDEIRRALERCAGDEKCKAAYPDLESVFYQVVEKLNMHNVEVNTADPRWPAWLVDAVTFQAQEGARKLRDQMIEQQAIAGDRFVPLAAVVPAAEVGR